MLAQGLTWHTYEGPLWPSPGRTTANAGASSWNTATGCIYFDNPAGSTIKGADGTTEVNGNAIPYLYPRNTNSTAGDNYTCSVGSS